MSDNFFGIRKGLNLSPQATVPLNPANGDVYYDSSLGKFQFYQFGAWVDFSGGASLSGPGSSIDNALVRFDGVTGTFLKSSTLTLSDVGVLAGLTLLDIGNLKLNGNTLSSNDANGDIHITPNGTGILDLHNNTRFRTLSQYDITLDAANGSDVALQAPSSKNIQLTNAGLVSVSTIPAQSSGTEIVLTNTTGDTIAINDESGAIAADRIRTGTGASLIILNNASITLNYDGVNSRWRVLGGIATPNEEPVYPYRFVINGPLVGLGTTRKRLDGAIIQKPFIPSIFKAGLETNGKTGSLKLDVRQHSEVAIPIIGVDCKDTAATQSISKLGSSLATQSINRTVGQFLTQSITRAKSQLSIASIIQVQGTNKWRINLTSTPDVDWSVGASVTITGATTVGNNVTAIIEDKNVDSSNNFIITNATGAQQLGAVGVINLALFSYNSLAPVSTQFVPGENVLFATHTTAANNGNKAIYKINQGGNNLWVYNATGVVQATVIGTSNVNRWTYAYLSAVSTTDYIVEEKALFAAHTTAGNNGSFVIKAVNQAGNNIVVYNELGATQAGILGNVNTNRWVYAYKPNAIFKSIAYSPTLTLYAATSESGDIHTSPDGITWTEQVTPEANSWNGICWGGTSFVAVASNGTFRVITSTDGITWIARNASNANTWRSVAYNGTVFAAVADTGAVATQVMTSPDGITWTNRTSSLATTWKSICANSAGRFVAVADSGATRSMTSADGITWSSVTALATASTWQSVTANSANEFVAVASSGATLVAKSSSTGLTWTNQIVSATNSWTAVTYNGTVYAAVSAGGDIATSPDGNTWTQRVPAESNQWNDIASNNTGVMVAVASTGNTRFMRSTDNGITWTAIVPGAAAVNAWKSICWNGTVFCAVADVGTAASQIVTSPDGITWTIRTTLIAAGSVCSNTAGRLVAVSTSGATRSMTSGDNGVTWTLTGGLVTASTWRSVSSDGTNFTAVADTGAIVVATCGSTGATWSNQIVSSANTWSAIAYGGGIYCAVATSGDIMTSTDGVTWTQRVPTESNQWNSVAWNGSVFCAVSSTGNNRVMTSPTGVTWTARTASIVNTWQSIAWNGTVFAAVADAGVVLGQVMTSPDGTTWTSRSSSLATTWKGICSNASGRFVAVASTGATRSMTSADGITWSSTGALAVALAWKAVTSNGTNFVAVSNDSSVSGGATCGSTGATWLNVTVASNNAWQAITYNSTLGLYVAVSSTGVGTRVMTSPTGATGTWTGRSSAADNSWVGIVSNGTNLVAVSSNGTSRVMSSIDAIGWTLRTTPIISLVSSTSFIDITYSSALGFYIALSASGTGNRISTSPTGAVWTTRSTPSDISWSGIVANGVNLVAVANQSSINLFSYSQDFGDTSWVKTRASVIANTAIAPDGYLTADKIVEDTTINNTHTVSKNTSFVAGTSYTETFYAKAAERSILKMSVGTSVPSIFAGISPSVYFDVSGGTYSGASITVQSANITSVGSGWYRCEIITVPASVTLTADSTVSLVSTGTTTSYTGDGISGLYLWGSSLGISNIMASTDAITWAPKISPSITPITSTGFNAVTYCSGMSLFVAVSSNGGGNRIATSTSGIVWKTQVSPADNGWVAITNNGTNVVAVANSGSSRAMISSNGIAWDLTTPLLVNLGTIAGDKVKFLGHTSTANDGIFTVMAVSSSLTLFTIVVYNLAGIAQASPIGDFFSSYKLIKFSIDQSSSITTSSIIELSGLSDQIYEENFTKIGYQVIGINDPNSAGYNVVISEVNALPQPYPAGYVVMESKSLFSSIPEILGTKIGINQPLKGIRGDYGTYNGELIQTNAYIAVWMMQNFTDASANDLTIIVG